VKDGCLIGVLSKSGGGVELVRVLCGIRRLEVAKALGVLDVMRILVWLMVMVMVTAPVPCL
jgi:hypothetical protein